MLCPCCSQKEFDLCCGPLLSGEAIASSPETLMRSRYAAYCQKNFPYLLETTDPQRRLDFDHEATQKWMNESSFLGLEVLNHSEAGTKGVVEFKARFLTASHADGEEVHHEVARFRKQAGRWYFRPK